MKKALFLDCDGVLIEDRKYLSDPKDISVFDEAIEMVKWANAKGLLVIVVTNQSGIARGYFTEEDYLIIKEEIISRFKTEDAQIDDWYYCPFHPEGKIEKFSKESEERKPGTGMHLKAQRKWDIDFEGSFMVGDKMSDVIDLPGLKNLTIKGEYPVEATSYNRLFKNHLELLGYFKSL